MSNRTLTDGSPVPADESHRTINPETGMQQGYVVLSAEERAKGFVKPLRRSYVHRNCGTRTTMGLSIAETYARDPRFYTGTFCTGCRSHFPLVQFVWEDGEPMAPLLQEAWHQQRQREAEERRQRRIAELRRELAELEGAAGSDTAALFREER